MKGPLSKVKKYLIYSPSNGKISLFVILKFRDRNVNKYVITRHYKGYEGIELGALGEKNR